MNNQTTKLLKLNLGCGHDYIAGWTNVDAVEDVKPDMILDLRSEWHWQNASVDEVLLKDILEHFTWEDLQGVMRELARVTKVGATVTVRVPNLDRIFTQFAHDSVVRNLFVYGATHATGVFGAHKVGFSPHTLTMLFVRYGFELQSLEGATTNWVATFVRVDDLEIKRVAWIMQTFSWGGAEVYFSELIPAMQQIKAKHTVITNNRQLRKSLRSNGVATQTLRAYADFVANWKALVKTIVFLPHTLFWYAHLLWQIRSFDVLVCATFTDKIIVTPFVRVFGVPVVWNEFGPVYPLLKKWLRLPEFAYRFASQFVQRIVVPSTHTKQSLSQKTHISLGLLDKVACGRDLEVLGAERSEAEVTAAQGLRSKNIVCVSRFDSGKGQLELVAAFAQVVREVPDARLILVGEGSELAAVQDKVTELGIQKSVQFKGFVENVVPEIQAARMCVFPSTWELEGFGLVAIEAMAIGKPVIAYNKAPMNEITLHDTTGVLIEPSNATALSEAMINLLTDDVKVNRLSTSARAHFREQYQIKRSAEEYMNQLLWAVASMKAHQAVSKWQRSESL